MKGFALGFGKLIEYLCRYDIVFRVVLLVSESNSILKHQNLSALDRFDKVVDPNRIEKPIPGKFGHNATILVRVEVHLAVEVKAHTFLSHLPGACLYLSCLNVYRCYFA